MVKRVGKMTDGRDAILYTGTVHINGRVIPVWIYDDFEHCWSEGPAPACFVEEVAA